LIKILKALLIFLENKMSYRDNTRFSGPIEEIVGNTCPGSSYCGIDQCFRNGKTCGNDSSCCLNRSQADDVVTALGCGGNVNSFTSSSGSDPKFSTLSEDTTAMSKCITQLTLEQSDVEYMCKNLSTDDCFGEMCKLGCDSPACPKSPPTNINLQNSVCQTIQQYCDVLDPSLLSDPNYNKLCCEVDPIAGIPVRTECGCPGRPCNSNPVVMQNVHIMKANAAQYWNENPLPNAPVIVQPSPTPTPSSVVVQPSSTPTPSPSSPYTNNNISVKKYLLLILLILSVCAGLYWWYFVKKKSSVNYSTQFRRNSYMFSPSDAPL